MFTSVILGKLLQNRLLIMTKTYYTTNSKLDTTRVNSWKFVL